MSSSPLKKGQNFEILYNSLKTEYDQALLDNDEICKEYESTIELLKNSLDKTTAEKEKLQIKNREKLLDIQDLTKLNDKLMDDIKKVKEEKKLKEAKIVFLENDNDHYQKKIRQFEALIDDLNTQLESTLEENITLQTEFEIYKQTTSEELMRKDEELQDCKSDIINKEKIIQQLNTKKIMKKLEDKIRMTEKTLKRYQRKYSETSLDKDKEKNINKNINNLKINTSLINVNIYKATNENNYNQTEIRKQNNDEDERLITPIFNTKAIIPDKFQEIYRKSIKNVVEFSSIKKDNKNDDKINADNNNDDNNVNINNVVKDIKINSQFHLDSLDSSSTQPKINENENEKEKEEDNLINNDEQDASSSCFSYEKKIFDNLLVCNVKVFSINSVKNLINDKLMKNKKLKENLQKLLILTTQRKSNLINRKKNYKDRLNRIGYKIRD